MTSSAFPIRKPSFPCFDTEGNQEIEVFEYQIYGLFGWQADHPKYADETGLISGSFHKLADMSCPIGYLWVTEWMINRDYTIQDDNGWSYGTSKDRIREKLINNCSNAYPTPRQRYRRRLWFRIVRIKNEESIMCSGKSGGHRSLSPTVNSAGICRVYENQKYDMFHGGWKTRNFILADFADEKVRSAVEYMSLDALGCLPGCLWTMEWRVDKYYTKMDSEGWSYGTTSDRVIDKYLMNKSTSRPTPRQVYRRRLWYRTMRRPSPAEYALLESYGRLGTPIGYSKPQRRSTEGRNSVSSVDSSTLQALRLYSSHKFSTFYSSRRRNLASIGNTEGVVYVTAIVCENQRLGNRWSRFNLTSSDWPALSDIAGVSSVDSLAAVELLDGYEWADQWSVSVRHGMTDTEGFHYASCFQDIYRSLMDEEAMVVSRVEISEEHKEVCAAVRTRCWFRHMVVKGQSRNVNFLPYVLRVDVRHVVGRILEAAERVRVEVEVDGVVMSSKASTFTPTAVSGDSNVSAQDLTGDRWAEVEIHDDPDRCKAYFRDHEFIAPLLCAPQKEVRVLLLGHKQSTCNPDIIGVATTDLLIQSQIRERVNRKVSTKLAVSKTGVGGAYETNGDICGRVGVVIELEEYSLFSLSVSSRHTLPVQSERPLVALLKDEPSPLPPDIYLRRLIEEAYVQGPVLPGLCTWLRRRIDSIKGSSPSLMLDKSILHDAMQDLAHLTCPPKRRRSRGMLDFRSMVRDHRPIFRIHGEHVESYFPACRLYPFPSGLCHRGVLMVSGDTSHSFVRVSPKSIATCGLRPLHRRVCDLLSPQQLESTWTESLCDPPASLLMEAMKGDGGRSRTSSAYSDLSTRSFLRQDEHRKRTYGAEVCTRDGGTFLFQWESEQEYVTFLRSMRRARTGSEVSLDQIARAYFPGMVASSATQWTFGVDTDPDDPSKCPLFTHPARVLLNSLSGTLQWELDERPSDVSLVDSDERIRKRYEIFLCDIDHLQLESSFEFPCPYVLSVHVSDLAVGSLNEKEHVVVRVCSNGQEDWGLLRCSSPADDGNSPLEFCTLQLFVSPEYCMSNSTMHVCLHVQGRGGDVRTLGECEVLIPELLYNAYSVRPTLIHHGYDGGSLDEREGFPSPRDNMGKEETSSNPETPSAGSIRSHADDDSHKLPATEAIFHQVDEEATIQLNVLTTSRHVVGPSRQSVQVQMGWAKGLVHCSYNLPVYCVAQLVDFSGATVVASQHKTKAHLCVASGAEWSENHVWGNESGLSFGAYVHVEVWSRSTPVHTQCIGEAYIPIADKAPFGMIEYPLVESPKSPSHFKTDYADVGYGMICIGVTVLHEESESRRKPHLRMKRRRSQSVPNDAHANHVCHRHGSVSMTASLSMANACGSTWLCRQVFHRGAREEVTLECLFCCSATYIGLRLAPYAAYREASCWHTSVPKHSLFGEHTLHNSGQHVTDDCRNTSFSNRFFNTHNSQPIHFDIKDSCEIVDNGVILIPWTQVFNPDVVSSSAVVVSAVLHSITPDGRKPKTIDFLVGPCPAESFVALINERYSLFKIRQELENVALQPDSKLLNASRLILSDLAVVAHDCVSALPSLSSTDPGHSVRPSTVTVGSECAVATVVDDNMRESILVDTVADKREVEEGGSIGLLLRILMYTAYVLFLCSEKVGNKQDEDGALLVASSGSGDVSLKKRPSLKHAILSAVSKSHNGIDDRSTHHEEYNDINCVEANINSLIQDIQDRVLVGWEAMTSPCRSQSGQQISLDYLQTALPHFASIIGGLLTVRFNQLLSNIDIAIRQLKENGPEEDLLRLCHVIFTRDHQIDDSLRFIFGLLDINCIAPMSLLRSVDGCSILDTFQSCLCSVLRKKVTEALRGKSCDMEGPLCTVPWEIIAKNGAFFVGPTPEKVYNVVCCFSKMIAIKDRHIPLESRYWIRDMNISIRKEIVASIYTMADRYKFILADMESQLIPVILAGGDGDSLGMKKRACICDAINFLVSLCNDISRLLCFYFPRIACHLTTPSALLDANEKAKCLEYLALVRWMTADVIARAVFSDMEDIFVNDFQSLSCGNSSVLSMLLSSLESRLTDLKFCMYPDCYECLLLSCGHMLVVRYFCLLRDQARQIARDNGIEIEGKGKEEKTKSQEYSVVDVGGHVQAVVDTLTRCAGDSSYLRQSVSDLCRQLQGVADAILCDSSISYSEFSGLLCELTTLGAPDEALKCIVKLKRLSFIGKQLAMIGVVPPRTSMTKKSSESLGRGWLWRSRGLAAVFKPQGQRQRDIRNTVGLSECGGMATQEVVADYYLYRMHSCRRFMKVSGLRLSNLSYRSPDSSMHFYYLKVLWGHSVYETEPIPCSDVMMWTDDLLLAPPGRDNGDVVIEIVELNPLHSKHSVCGYCVIVINSLYFTDSISFDVNTTASPLSVSCDCSSAHMSCIAAWYIDSSRKASCLAD